MLRMLFSGALFPHALRPFPAAVRHPLDAGAPPQSAPRPAFGAGAGLLAAASLALGTGGTAAAQCATATTGAGCVTVPAALRSPEAPGLAGQQAGDAAPLVEIGDRIERGRFSMLLNAGYYGLPPVRDGWVYMRIGQDVYRVDWRTHEVLERVTHQTASNF